MLCVEGSGGSPPSLSLEAPEFQNVPCCPSLVSTLLHPKSLGSWDQYLNRNQEFKSLQLSSPGGWGTAAECTLPKHFSKTLYPHSPSYFLEIEPIITTKKARLEEVLRSLSATPAVTSVAHQNLHFHSYSSSRSCLCFEVSLAICTK